MSRSAFDSFDVEFLCFDVFIMVLLMFRIQKRTENSYVISVICVLCVLITVQSFK